MTFESWMREQYQWEEQFDMEPQYSQLDMEAAFNSGRAEGIKWAEIATAKVCADVVKQVEFERFNNVGNPMQKRFYSKCSDAIKEKFGLEI